MLGHSKPALLGVYAPSAPLRDTRDALERWGEELARILGEGEGSEAEATQRVTGRVRMSRDGAT